VEGSSSLGKEKGLEDCFTLEMQENGLDTRRTYLAAGSGAPISFGGKKGGMKGFMGPWGVETQKSLKARGGH